MKKLLIIISIVAVLALGAGLFSYHAGLDCNLSQAARRGDTLAWLRRDFHLTPEQYAAVCDIHREYAGQCAEHCREILEAVGRRDALRSAAQVSPSELAAAERRVQELSDRCGPLILRHLERVASQMSPQEGRRYLKMMQPLLANRAPSVAANIP